jgi:hypothetical protein
LVFSQTDVSGNGKTTPKRARNIKRKFNDNGIFTE